MWVRRLAPVAFVALFVLGAFLLRVVAGSLTSVPSLFSYLFMSVGALCLLSAEYVGTVSLKVTPSPARVHPERTGLTPTRLTAVGVAMALLGPFVFLPIGCNTGQCTMDPTGTWSTIWPNVLVLELGLVLAGLGMAERRPERLRLAGLGFGLIVGGVALLILGSVYSLFTFCPVNGCPPLTGSAWWSVFWPNVVAQSLGAVLVAAGSAAVLIAARQAFQSKQQGGSRSDKAVKNEGRQQNTTTVKRTTKLVLGSAALLVLGLFLLPVVPIMVVDNCNGGIECPVSVIPISASASVMYAYFGAGAVQVPGSLAPGHVYCLMYGNPGTMCGAPWQRMG
jgi:hypothetical protein